MLRPWSKISWKDWMFFLRLKKNPDRFHQFGGYIKCLKGRWLVKSEIIKDSSRERQQPRFFRTPRALETSCVAPWSRFALEMKALFINFPETRFANQEIFKKGPRNCQESCKFDHLDVFARYDCAHRMSTRRSVHLWSRFALNMKALFRMFPEINFPNRESSRKVPRNCQESCKFDHLDVVTGFDCVYSTFTRRSIGFWSRSAPRWKLFSDFSETRFSNQESSRKGPRNCQEGCNFNGHDIYDCAHWRFTSCSVGFLLISNDGNS